MSMRTVGSVIIAVLLAAGCGQSAPGTSAQRTPTQTVTADAASQEYRTLATVLEEPDGAPMMCHAVAESYPPQCGGPEIVGWDWDEVEGEESASGVTWVDAVLTGTWDGRKLTLTRPAEPASAWPESPPPDPAEFAPACDDPDVVDPSHGYDEVDAVIEPLEQADVSTIWVSDPAGDRDGPFVLSVVVAPGRADDITALIRRDYDGPLCVVERDLPSMAELSALQDEIIDAQGDGGTPLGPPVGSYADTERGIVVVQVIAATDEARAWAKQRWGGRVELEGMLQPVAAASGHAGALEAAVVYRTAAEVIEADGQATLCYARATIRPRDHCGFPEIVGWDWDEVDGEESAGGVTVSTVVEPAGEDHTAAPFGRLYSVGFDHHCGGVVAEVLVADEPARAFARRRWGDRVELMAQLLPVDGR
jgi:hypothetical protein